MLKMVFNWNFFKHFPDTKLYWMILSENLRNFFFLTKGERE